MLRGSAMKTKNLRPLLYILLSILIFSSGCRNAFRPAPLQGYGGEKRSSHQISRVEYRWGYPYVAENLRVVIDGIGLPTASMGIDLLPGRHKLRLTLDYRKDPVSECSKSCAAPGDCYFNCLVKFESYICDGTFVTEAPHDLQLEFVSESDPPYKREVRIERKLSSGNSSIDTRNASIPCKSGGLHLRNKSYQGIPPR